MKISGVCPKCHHHQLLHVKQVADRIGKLGGGAIHHGTDDAPEPGLFYPWRIARLKNRGGIFSSNVMAAGLVEAYICRRCGFTELYTRNAEDIEVDGDLVREIDGPETGPFR
jgi:predicted nucleic-acid-binding Zn-ribbon protein